MLYLLKFWKLMNLRIKLVLIDENHWFAQLMFVIFHQERNFFETLHL
jgi:hypothetical protein